MNTHRSARYHLPGENDLEQGDLADVYFHRTLDVLAAEERNPVVRAEFACKSLPGDWRWAVLAGLDEATELLSTRSLDARALPEGTVFGEREPVLEVRGPYQDFCLLETSLLGFLCQASGVATAAARCRIAAGDRTLLSFGARRLHPGAVPAVERAAYVGGCDGVSTVAGARAAGISPSGTIPHALILVLGDTVGATEAFHGVVREGAPRISLIDTFHDEQFEAIRVAEELGDALDGLRLDTPGTRKGDFPEIFHQVRWELDRRGFDDIELFASGGIDEDAILELNEVVDGYGVGGAISAAPIVDFSMDIVEIEGRPVAKRGKRTGAKQLFRCRECESRVVRPLAEPVPPECVTCGSPMDPLLEDAVVGGEVARREDASTIRNRVLRQIQESKLTLSIVGR